MFYYLMLLFSGIIIDSYKKENWLNVVWFCHDHHRARHVELKDMGVTL